MTQNLDNHSVRSQLDRILAHTLFVRSHRQCDLLSYLVKESLAGRGSRIKATSIAMDVFGRDESFDQQRDTIVRVEAGRLRRRLQEYYDDAGKDDPIHIEIPKGSYQPIIKQQTVSADIRGEPNAGGSSDKYRLARYPLFALFIILGTALFLIVRQDEPNSNNEQTATQALQPFVMILPFSSDGTDEHGGKLAFGLVESLITKMAKMEGLAVMAHASILEQQQKGGPPSVQLLRRELGVTHVLRGSLEQEADTIVINVQLVDTSNGTVTWADRLVQPQRSVLRLEEELALQIASELKVQVGPAEKAMLALSHASNPEALVLYRQALVMLIPPNDMTRIETARRLFQRAREMDPGFAGGFAGESFSHSITVLFLNTRAPEKALSTALSLAENAIATDANFGMSYAVKSFAQVMQGDLEQALKNADLAVELQPGDAFTRFIQGMNLIIAGQAEQAIPVLEQALRLDPLESRTPYMNVLGIAQYAAGKYEDADRTFEYNLARRGPRGPHMAWFIAATHAQLGRESEAAEVLDQAKQQAPLFPGEDWLEMWLGANNQFERTLELLKTAE